MLGKIDEDSNGIIKQRPFRAPHYTISQMGFVGGGRIPKPGEISLAHNGVLFLDEFPEFSKRILETLRGPLEDNKVNLTRINLSLEYPCKFMLLASMNPCSCGYYGSADKKCTCTDTQIKRYKAKISGPLLDRIDIKINIPNTKYEDFDKNEELSSSVIKKRVNAARKLQTERYKEYDISSNSELNLKLMEKFCVLNDSCKKLLEQYYNKLNFSGRTYLRILRVARTIADLEEKEFIDENHVLEAIGYSKNFENK